MHILSNLLTVVPFCQAQACANANSDDKHMEVPGKINTFTDTFIS